MESVSARRFFCAPRSSAASVKGRPRRDARSRCGPPGRIVAARDEFTEDEIYDAMDAAGLPDAIAHRAYLFTQTAWSRGMLEGSPRSLARGSRSPDYCKVEPQGSERPPAGRLDEQDAAAVTMRALGV